MQGSPPGREGSAPEGSREISAIRDRSALCPGFFSLLLQHGKIIAQGACQEKDALKEKRLIVLCLFQFTDAPMLRLTFFFIKRAFKRIIYLQKFNVMAPCQKVRQRLTFWIGQIKPSHIDYITMTEAFAISICQISGKSIQYI